MGSHVRRNLKHLRGLSLDGGRFNDKGLRGLIKLTALRALSLCRCQDITDKGLRAVVVPLSRQSLAWVDVTDCERLTHDASTVGPISSHARMCWFMKPPHETALESLRSAFPAGGVLI